jgi:hypothetical protein
MSENKRRMPVKVTQIKLSGDYEGWEAEVRSNPPMRVFESLLSGKIETIRDALIAVVKSWNFVDEEGEPLPLSADGLMGMPLDLTLALVKACSDAISVTPGN